MRRYVLLALVLLTITAMAALLIGRLATESQAVSSPVSVLTQHNDNARSGLNLNETTLTAANVNANQFGKLFSRAVDGQLYAQPLYVPNLAIPGRGTHNVVFLATMHNSVYAYDADDPAQSSPVWQVNLGPSIPMNDTCFGQRYGPLNAIQIEIGIVSTPVIDPSTNTMYVVTDTKDAPSGFGQPCNPAAYVHRLHALDITTGQEKFGGPVVIQASALGTGADSSGGVITFNSEQGLQRASLLLANGVVYLAFASYADTDPYHGWLLGYSAGTLQQKYVFLDSPHPDGSGSYEGGIWQSGQGPSADASGNIYLNIGNGNWDAGSGGADYGDSVVKLSPSLSVLDWFTPYNQSYLSASDLDLGSSGVLVIPGTNLLLAGGKQGVLYLLNSSNLGHFNAAGDTQIVQSFQAGLGHIHGSPVCWNGPNGELCYVWSEQDYLKAYRFAGGVFAGNPVVPAYQSAMTVPPGMPGGFLALSANGTAAGTGILWTATPLNGDANQATVPGILRAFDATNLTELWDSQ